MVSAPCACGYLSTLDKAHMPKGRELAAQIALAALAVATGIVVGLTVVLVLG